MQHIGTEPITTKRLYLRKYQPRDVADIYKNYATDERVTRFLSWEPYEDIETLQEYISAQIAAYNPRMYHWAIEYQGQVIGSISVIALDEKNESCEIGYCLGYEFWGKGIMTEATEALLQFLFFQVGFHRICAKHDVENPASGKVMLKCNMHYEGRLREHYLRHDGTRGDSLLYNILKGEFIPAE